MQGEIEAFKSRVILIGVKYTSQYMEYLLEGYIDFYNIVLYQVAAAMIAVEKAVLSA